MNLKHAQYILAILEAGSISAAAHKLFISQPALSQTVKYVEQNLGLPLFEKRSGVLQLTLAGKYYIETARQILLMEQNLENKIHEIRQDHIGILRFGITVQNSATVLPRILTEFQRQYPLVQIEITEKGSSFLSKMVMERRLDIAQVRGAERDDQIIYEELQPECIGLLAGAGTRLYTQYPNNTSLELQAAADERFVFLKEGHSTRSTQDKICEKNDIHLKKLIEVDNFETAKRITLQCGGVMVAPLSTLRSDEQALKDAHFYPLKNVSYAQSTYLIHRKDLYMTPFMQCWCKLLKEVYNR